MEPEPYSCLLNSNIFIVNNLARPDVIITLITMLFLLMVSALISGSEVAFFSLSHAHIAEIKSDERQNYKRILQLLGKPQRLLATILITNNFVNIGIIIISTFLTDMLFDFSDAETLGFIFQVIVVTFLILLFGEIIPKVYANYYSLQFASFMTYPLYVLDRLFKPVSFVLISSTSFIRKKFQKKQANISLDDLSGALDLTESSIQEDKDILKGIVSFSNIIVKGIMCPRVDVFAIDLKNKPTLAELTEAIHELGYSRIPIYEETFDNIVGVLYAKDLLPYLDKPETTEWSTLIRKPYYVPESKKINELLREFQTEKIHLAIVIDEYGGTKGIVTLEDILEEIVGEISDEYDDDEIIYKQLDDGVFIFEGKILLHDFYKIIAVDAGVFNQVKGDADTLAGLILELKGEIPKKGEKIEYKNFLFRIEAGDNRRIKKIKVELKKEPEKNEEENER